MKIEQVLKKPDAYIGKVIEVEGDLVDQRKISPYLNYVSSTDSVAYEDSIFLSGKWEDNSFMPISGEKPTPHDKEMAVISTYVFRSIKRSDLHNSEIKRRIKIRGKLIPINEREFQIDLEKGKELIEPIYEFPLALIEIEMMDIHREADGLSFFYSKSLDGYDDFGSTDLDLTPIETVLSNLDDFNDKRTKVRGVLFEYGGIYLVPSNDDMLNQHLGIKLKTSRSHQSYLGDLLAGYYPIPQKTPYSFRFDCQIIGTVDISDNPKFGAKFTLVEQLILNTSGYLEGWDYSQYEYVEGLY